MKVNHLFSSSTGDIPVDETLRSRPFLLGPLREHPYLKLGDYFKAIERFVLGSEGEALMRLLSQGGGNPVSLSDVGEILIRSEKHGGLYHLSSVEVIGPGTRHKFVVSTAVTETSREWLQREFQTLNLLNDSFHLPYLPEIYRLEEIEWPTPGGSFKLKLMLGQWFEGFHEWHLHKGDSGEPRLVIWDLQDGYRRAEDWEISEIYRQAAMTLTLYYNVKSTHQIHPWLHSAGDFIVRSRDGAVDVRLTTARGYEPLMVFLEERELNTLTALVYFFLNLTIRMRLDRWEGVGEVAWAEDSCIRPTVEGFLQALRSMEEEGRYGIGSPADFVSLLKSFQEDELGRLCRPLLGFYRQESPEAAAMIEGRLDSHCRALRSVIQGTPG